MSTNDRITRLEAQTQDLHTRLQAREDEIARLTAAHAQAHAEVAELQREDRDHPRGRPQTYCHRPQEHGPLGDRETRWSFLAPLVGGSSELPQLRPEDARAQGGPPERREGEEPLGR